MSGASKKNQSTQDISQNFANILAESLAKTNEALQRQAEGSARTDKAIEKLTVTVEELVKSHIETKKDREYDAIRMERIEKNQKEQGSKIETINDTVLLLNERVGNQKDSWTTLSKWVLGVLSIIITAVITVNIV